VVRPSRSRSIRGGACSLNTATAACRPDGRAEVLCERTRRSARCLEYPGRSASTFLHSTQMREPGDPRFRFLSPTHPTREFTRQEPAMEVVEAERCNASTTRHNRRPVPRNYFAIAVLKPGRPVRSAQSFTTRAQGLRGGVQREQRGNANPRLTRPPACGHVSRSNNGALHITGCERPRTVDNHHHESRSSGQVRRRRPHQHRYSETASFLFSRSPGRGPRQ